MAQMINEDEEATSIQEICENHMHEEDHPLDPERSEKPEIPQRSQYDSDQEKYFLDE
jgi:hypothetical protein